MARWVLVGLLVFLAGCPPQRERVAPQDEREALARVNDNLTQIDEPLQYKALVSFRFRDAGGKTRRFIGHEASLLFAAPQYLRFEMRSLTGVVAQFGSNDERYWVWIEPEVQKLWWGSWDQLREAAPRRLIVPPDDLLDALMLRPLSPSFARGMLPLLRYGDEICLEFVRLDADGEIGGMREIRLDPFEPYQPLEIVDRLPDGRVQMHALLDNYRRIGDDGPYTARKYVVDWPLDGAQMRLDVTRARFRPELPLEVFAFPSGWQGEVELLDHLPATDLPPAMTESALHP